MAVRIINSKFAAYGFHWIFIIRPVSHYIAAVVVGRGEGAKGVKEAEEECRACRACARHSV